MSGGGARAANRVWHTKAEQTPRLRRRRRFVCNYRNTQINRPVDREIERSFVLMMGYIIIICTHKRVHARACHKCALCFCTDRERESSLTPSQRAACGTPPRFGLGGCVCAWLITAHDMRHFASGCLKLELILFGLYVMVSRRRAN